MGGAMDSIIIDDSERRLLVKPFLKRISEKDPRIYLPHEARGKVVLIAIMEATEAESRYL
jgi:hypothetical protein